MNYRHVYHAGNFADVLKHAVLALVIEHLKQKDAAFRLIDTHAGVGLYDLSSMEAQKTGEWRHGIGRLAGRELPREIAPLLAPYLGVVHEAGSGDGAITHYPGSPLIARRLMRRQDRLIANELHAEDQASLARLFAGDPQVKVMAIDGWAALKALLPPKERRGAVLVDPPFEEPGELARLAEGLAAAHRRFATGTVMLWYPIKDVRDARAFQRQIRSLAIEKLLIAELMIRAPGSPGTLNGTGIVISNPPFTLHDKLAALLPFLSELLAQGAAPAWHLEWLGTSALN
jgi:23S rRNA (adenine2030-N6)-methyltransferase